MSIYNPNGGYLSKDEIIQSLSAENNMLRKELNGYTHMNQKYMGDCVKVLTEIAQINNKVERLTKAGNELERVLISRSGSYEAGNASHEWQSAKNYKPSV